jgi:hypothetical protein
VARLLFAAHDPGGALILSALQPEAQRRGYDVVFTGAGPAVSLWRERGLDVTEARDGEMPGIGFPPQPVDALVTGTGFSEFERGSWGWARERRIPSLGIVDSWTNFDLRFGAPDGRIFPDAVGVIDENAHTRISGLNDFEAPVMVVGQPYLQIQTQVLERARAEREAPNKRRLVVFFSEPIREDYGEGRGFDQFSVFHQLVKSLPSKSNADVLIKPHPREETVGWRQALIGYEEQCQLTNEPTPALTANADGIIGMTTMVLLEAHLAGIPTLSLQPNRTDKINPVIDEFSEVITNADDFGMALERFWQQLGSRTPVLSRFQNILADSDRRLVSAIEQIVNKSPDS